MKDSHRKPCRLWWAFPFTLYVTIILVILSFSLAAYAGQWRVMPVRIFFDRQVKSSVITIINDSEDTLHLQCKAMEWTQDQDGKDIYQETKDLVFFPRILMLKKGEQKIVRAGLRVPATSKEKTYRLFIEETPQTKADTPGASQLTVAIRFGVAVFAKPLNEAPSAELTSLSLEKGVISATIKNTGNVHLMIQEIQVNGINGKGEVTFSDKLNGWYLLSGSTRSYSMNIPLEKCAVTEQLDITATTNMKVTLNKRLQVEKAKCRP